VPIGGAEGETEGDAVILHLLVRRRDHPHSLTSGELQDVGPHEVSGRVPIPTQPFPRIIDGHDELTDVHLDFLRIHVDER